MGAQGKASSHVSDDSVSVITGALDAAGLEPFIPTPQILDKWAELLLQQDTPPDEVSRWQQEFNALEGKRAKRGGACGGALRGRRKTSVDEQQLDATACSVDGDEQRSALHSPPLMPDLHRSEESAAGATSDPAAAASTASAAAMTAAFIAAACDDSEDLLVREARSNSGCANRAEQQGQADDASQAEHLARLEEAGATARQRLDSPPLFYSNIRLPSPPLRLGEEVDFPHESMGAFGAGLADVAEEGEDVADWWYGGNSGEDGDEGGEDLLSLVYDPVLMCYYETTTGRYFQLKDGTQA